ncbi:Protein of unknown function UPF0118 [Raphidiopsis brookii D9]|nr:Protein of unknown function UPF0118 [Raphidiopsis brookii D9]
MNVWLLSLLFHYFQHPITILSIAAILAFLLNYPVQLLEKARITRTYSVIIVLVITLTLLVILGFTLVPMLVEQTTQLLRNIPDWVTSSQENLSKLQVLARQKRLHIDFSVVSSQINASVQNILQQIASGAVGFAGTLLSALLNIVLVVVLAFYMLIYGDRLWSGLINQLPSYIGLPLSKSLQLNFHNFFFESTVVSIIHGNCFNTNFFIFKSSLCSIICDYYRNLRTSSCDWCYFGYRVSDLTSILTDLVVSISSSNGGNYHTTDQR